MLIKTCQSRCPTCIHAHPGSNPPPARVGFYCCFPIMRLYSQATGQVLPRPSSSSEAGPLHPVLNIYRAKWMTEEGNFLQLLKERAQARMQGPFPSKAVYWPHVHVHWLILIFEKYKNLILWKLCIYSTCECVCVLACSLQHFLTTHAPAGHCHPLSPCFTKTTRATKHTTLICHR